MPGTTLSRWTMSFFATALSFLIGGEVMMALGYGFPSADIAAPETLLLVHVVAIGWLSLLMAGALLQFVPVLVARPLCGERFALPALVLIVTGLFALLFGFADLSGGGGWVSLALPTGALLLAAGFSTLVGILAVTLWRARPLPLPARFVAVGLAALAVTTLLGGCFALTLAGIATDGAMAGLVVSGVPLHAILGLAGWLSFTAVGVSYRLLPMFMLSPEKEKCTNRFVLGAGGLALLLVAAAAPAAIAWEAGMAGMLVAALLLGLAAIAVYGGDAVEIYRRRKRRTMELNSRMTIVALAGLLATVPLSAGAVFLGLSEALIGALVFLAAFGWLTFLGLAQLYKIIPFMTWLECYGPVLGRAPTPRVQDLVDERNAVAWFALFGGSVAVATLAILFSHAGLFRIAAVGLLIATIGLVCEFALARRLAHVSSALRHPQGAVRPNLFLPHMPRGGHHGPAAL